MTERTDYEDALHAEIESAIRNHWEVCKGTHGGNDGWFKCEASYVRSSLAAAFDCTPKESSP